MPIRRILTVDSAENRQSKKTVDFELKNSETIEPSPERLVHFQIGTPEPPVTPVDSLFSETSSLKSPEDPQLKIGENIDSSPEIAIRIRDATPIDRNRSPQRSLMDASSDGLSLIADDDDATSSLNFSLDEGRVRRRSIAYENPELTKMIKKSGRPFSENLGAVSETGGTHRPSSVPLFLAGSELDEIKKRREHDILTEEEDGSTNVTPGSATAAAVDTIYEMFMNSESGKVSLRKFLNALTATGIRTTDPRLDQSMHALKKITKRYGADFRDTANTVHLNEQEFKEMIKPNAMTISRVLRTKFVIPEWNEFCRHIFRLYSLCKKNDAGKPSDFIPQLAAYDPDYWAVSVCSVDGQRFSEPDDYVRIPFCLQAVSRVLNYAIVLNDLGADKVHNHIGQEPSGRNARELVLDEHNKPHNPMINSGAIVTTALLKSEEKHMADRFDAVYNVYKKMAGNNEFLGFCNQAYLSERSVSYRNFALGYFLRENKCLPEPERLNETLELMLQLCAVEVTCESLAVIASTLANGGVCPITGEYVIGSNCVRDVLSLMYTTGMNDYSGQFAFHVGLPAKSSISGAIMLVIPNVMGIALWSPSLDSRLNSSRGLQFCTELVKVFNFHNYDNLKFTQRKLDPRKLHVEDKAHKVVMTLFSAANGDLTALSRLFLQGMDLSVADYDRRTPLHIAAAEGHMNCVKFLVEKARVPSRPVDRWNNTPADDARYHAHPEIADYLENWDLKRKTSAPKSERTISFGNGTATNSTAASVYETSQSEAESDP